MSSKSEVVMKKFIQVSFIVLVVMALAVSALALTGTGSAMAGKAICPMVGWNTRSLSCSTSSVLPDAQALAIRLPIRTPDVGWNS
jgi:hypothetical protein